jgi:hypothetical protein
MLPPVPGLRLRAIGVTVRLVLRRCVAPRDDLIWAAAQLTSHGTAIVATEIGEERVRTSEERSQHRDLIEVHTAAMHARLISYAEEDQEQRTY